VVSATPGPLYSRYPLYRRLGRPQGRSGRVWKISPLTRIRSPDRPVRSESLYRLSYPGPQFGLKNVDNLRVMFIVHLSIKICFPSFLNFQTNSESSASFSKENNFNLIFHYIIRQRLATFVVFSLLVASLRGVKSQ
jgi:hypothetical protein